MLRGVPPGVACLSKEAPSSTCQKKQHLTRAPPTRSRDRFSQMSPPKLQSAEGYLCVTSALMVECLVVHAPITRPFARRSKHSCCLRTAFFVLSTGCLPPSFRSPFILPSHLLGTPVGGTRVYHGNREGNVA